MAERGAVPNVPAARRRAIDLVKSFTSPLLPDDYLELLNPLWSTRELRGRVVRIERETPKAVTVTIKPGWEWPSHRPGQYIRLGVAVEGIHHWRAYSLTSAPGRSDGCISITPKLLEGGKVSPFLNGRMRPGTIVRLGGVEGTFVLPDPLPGKLLFVSAGSGVTPIASMLRHLAAGGPAARGPIAGGPMAGRPMAGGPMAGRPMAGRPMAGGPIAGRPIAGGPMPGGPMAGGPMGDVVHLHCARAAEDVIFGSELRDLDSRYPGYRLHLRLTGLHGRIEPEQLDALCPDWGEREAFVCGPPGLLDTMGRHWREHGQAHRLHVERFQPDGRVGDGERGTGGEIRFRRSGVVTASDGEQPILAAGEAAGAKLPYGCRMGICHTCVGKLRAGRVRDLRTGRVHGAPGEIVRTCVNAPEGAVEVDL